MVNDLEKTLKEKLDSEKAAFPETWLPEEGDTLLGVTTNIRKPITQYGPTKVWEIKGAWVQVAH